MRRTAKSLFIWMILASVILADDEQAGFEFFENKIRPVLAQQCYSCHAANVKSLKGGLYLDTRAGIRQGGESGHAVVPGEVDESLIIGALRHEDFEMPPKGKLPDQVIDDFVHWIKIGAPDPRDSDGPAAVTREMDMAAGRNFWAFQRLSPVEVPDGNEWAHTDIDSFVLRWLHQEGLQPVADASPEILVRRLYFDLIGLPPSPQQIEDFLADTSAGAVERLVDQLLDSSAFGERWGRHWLDLARYAESIGRTRNYAHPFAYRYRDYVIDALNADLPYNEFVRQQIAGDLLDIDVEEGRHQATVATAFLALGPHDLNERDVAKFHMDVVDEQINVVCRSILGLTAGCARCHDHKFDPIPTTDYYGLAGIFRSTDLLIGYASRQGGNKTLSADRLVTLGEADSEAQEAAEQVRQQEIEKLESRIENTKSQLAEYRRAMNPQNASRDKEGKNKKNAAKKNDAQSDDAKNSNDATRSRLTAAQARQRFDKTKQQQKRLTQQLKQLRQDKPLADNLAMGVAESKSPRDSRVHVRGDVKSLGDSVTRGLFQVLAADRLTLENPDQSGRLELAMWLTDAELPAGSLAARVMVNRVWHHLFGQGLVRTVDNFGEMGDRPSHPELLDYLAQRFVDADWSLKSIIREIVLTRTYQLSSEFNQDDYNADPDNRFVWRQNTRRLQAEALRDAMLAVSGELDPKRPNSRKYGKGEMNPGQTDSSDNRYRSIYLPVVRNFLPQMLSTFDFADPNDVHGRRDVTTVAPQALFMMNNEFVIKRAEAAAARRISNESMDDSTAIHAAYRSALGRQPSDTEVQRAAQYLSSARGEEKKEKADAVAWASFYQALFASAEFRYVN